MFRLLIGQSQIIIMTSRFYGNQTMMCVSCLQNDVSHSQTHVIAHDIYCFVSMRSMQLTELQLPLRVIETWCYWSQLMTSCVWGYRAYCSEPQVNQTTLFSCIYMHRCIPNLNTNYLCWPVLVQANERWRRLQEIYKNTSWIYSIAPCQGLWSRVTARSPVWRSGPLPWPKIP